MIKARKDILDLFPPGPIVGVEVGTDCGIFASQLLESRSDLFLWTVDPWDTTGNYPEPGRVKARALHKELMLPYVDRTCHVLMLSTDAAAKFKGEGVLFDFIYLDADHEAESVRFDLLAWWPLLKVGGLMAGHDFNSRMVHTPVIDFAVKRRLDLRIINQHGDDGFRHPDHPIVFGNPSWWFFKPAEDRTYTVFE